MDCNPNALAFNARSLEALFGFEDEVIVYLLCQWASGPAAEDGGLLGGEGSELLGGDGAILIAP